jgi:hypothetical protein
MYISSYIFSGRIVWDSKVQVSKKKVLTGARELGAADGSFWTNQSYHGPNQDYTENEKSRPGTNHDYKKN